MKPFLIPILFLTIFFTDATAQYWQQKVAYTMNIVMDTEKNRFSGHQEIVYTNNSPDTLKIVYYHLYYNAFQPGSMMDERAKNIIDPDQRIGKRISELQENEIGFHKITSLKQDETDLILEEHGTILKAYLSQPLLPGGKTVLEMDFESQVPAQIRRTGRNNIEGIDYSMSQWYPKLVEYDRDGWNAVPYIAREFHGVWGDFDVTILMDSSYTIAATGILQHPEKIGKGYAHKTEGDTSRVLSWNFKAKNVHDFVWTADPDYIHTIYRTSDMVDLHFFYQNDSSIIKNWEILPFYTAECFRLMGNLVGKYPYSSYSVIQGGDGGMEYPMATLILGNGKTRGLIGVMVHEVIHSWFQGVLANNEGKYPWMDEGFNTYYNHIVIDSLFQRNNESRHKDSYNAYFQIKKAGFYEPLSTHSDHYFTNRAYGVAAYSMGCIFLNQLCGVIGEETVLRSMKKYYREWQFKHPEPRDLEKILERESGMELGWYFNYFINTSKTMDYAIVDSKKSGKQTIINLKNNGDFPMPVDLNLTKKDGHVLRFHIPTEMTMGSKIHADNKEVVNCTPWPWTSPSYQLKIDLARKDIEIIEIDPEKRTMDINRENNVYPGKH